MTIALEGAVEELKGMIPLATGAAKEFAEIKAMSEHFEQTILDHINDKDGWLSNYKKDLRSKVYGSCAACVVFPLACIPCYAASATTLETKFKALSQDLQQAKGAMRLVAGHFHKLAELSGDMKNQSQLQESNMILVKGKMLTTLRIIKPTSVRIWRSYAVKNLGQLRKLLQRKLDEA